jgi:hypothetical protein
MIVLACWDDTYITRLGVAAKHGSARTRRSVSRSPPEREGLAGENGYAGNSSHHHVVMWRAEAIEKGSRKITLNHTPNRLSSRQFY